MVTPRLQLHIVGWALAGGLIALLTRTMFGVTVTQALAFAVPLSLLAVRTMPPTAPEEVVEPN